MNNRRILVAICLVGVLLGASILTFALNYGFSWNNYGNHRIFGKQIFNGEMETRTITLDAFQEIDLDLSLVRLEISEGDKYELRLVRIPKDTVQYEQKGELLSIWSDYDNRFDYQLPNNSQIYLSIPEGVTIRTTKIDISMADINIDEFTSKELIIESSMSNIDIDGTIEGMLSVNSSMANVNFKGILGNTSIFHNSMGNIDIIAIGSIEDYFVEIDNSMGNINYNGKNYTDWNETYNMNQRALNTIEISNSMGNVSIKFK